MNEVVDVDGKKVPKEVLLTKICVVAGGPCSGKTTVMNGLCDKGFPVYYEPAEELLREAVAKGQSAQEARADRKQWQRRVVEADFTLFTGLDSNRLAFVDTSMVETYVYTRMAGLDFGENLMRFMKNFRFASVFFLEALEVHEETAVRMEDRDAARQLGADILAAYSSFGYKPIVVPSLGVEERLERILAAYL